MIITICLPAIQAFFILSKLRHLIGATSNLSPVYAFNLDKCKILSCRKVL